MTQTHRCGIDCWEVSACRVQNIFDTTYLERSCPAKDEKLDSSNLPMREAEQFFVKEISFTRPAFSNLVFSSFPGTACNLLSRRINNRWNARLLKLMIKIQDFLVESKVPRVSSKTWRRWSASQIKLTVHTLKMSNCQQCKETENNHMLGNQS